MKQSLEEFQSGYSWEWNRASLEEFQSGYSREWNRASLRTNEDKFQGGCSSDRDWEQITKKQKQNAGVRR